MFAKLFHYEFCNLKKIAAPLVFAVLLAGVLAAISGFFLTYSMLNSRWDMSVPVGSIFAVIVLFLMFVIVLVSGSAMSILLIYRYYKSTAGDEAYLTFTLPVTANQIIWSKLLNAIVWLIFLFLSVLIALGMVGAAVGGGIALFGESDLFEFLEELRWLAKDFVSLYSDNVPYLVLQGISALLSPVITILLCYAIIGFVCMITQKHRVLIVVVLIFAVSSMESFFGGALETVTLFLPDDMYQFWTNISAALQLLLSCGIGVGSYFLTKYLMEKKLNLE